LEKILKSVEKKQRASKRALPRRFIVFEGVYYNHGDVCPLPKILELKDKYKYRLIMDDSCGIGVLGKTGRGTCEHYNIPVKTIEILCGNLDLITSSVGGFCCGNKAVVFHQRLHSAGYVYSASLPPLLTVASHAAFDLLDEQPDLPAKIARNAELMYKGLSSISGMTITSTPKLPIIHFRLQNPAATRLETEKILQRIADEALENGVFLTRAKYSQDEKHPIIPSIRICISAAQTTDQLNNAVEVIKKAVNTVLGSQTSSPATGRAEGAKKRTGK